MFPAERTAAVALMDPTYTKFPEQTENLFGGILDAPEKARRRKNMNKKNNLTKEEKQNRKDFFTKTGLKKRD